MIQIWQTIFFRWVGSTTNYDRNGIGPREVEKGFNNFINNSNQVGRRRIRTFNWSNFDVQGLVGLLILYEKLVG